MRSSRLSHPGPFSCGFLYHIKKRRTLSTTQNLTTFLSEDLLATVHHDDKFSVDELFYREKDVWFLL